MISGQARILLDCAARERIQGCGGCNPREWKIQVRHLTFVAGSERLGRVWLVPSSTERESRPPLIDFLSFFAAKRASFP